MTDIVKKALSELGCEYDENISMATRTSFKTGGNAEFMVYPDNIEQLSSVLRVCKNNSVKTYIIGNGSNILVSDNGLSGVVVRLSNNLSDIVLRDETTIEVESGASLKKLCLFALENGLSGLEFAYGIPGTAGGAAYMNAGAYGGEMKDVLFKCEHIDSDGNKGFFENEDLKLGYRHSVYSDSSFVITKLYLKMKKGDPEEIKALMNLNMEKRKAKQPLEYPSAGSTFKRPEGYFAGALIEECGLKGFSVGGAQVSEKHAGFVINKGEATTGDILELINHIQKVVLEQKGVKLETEVKYLD